MIIKTKKPRNAMDVARKYKTLRGTCLYWVKQNQEKGIIHPDIPPLEVDICSNRMCKDNPQCFCGSSNRKGMPQCCGSCRMVNACAHHNRCYHRRSTLAGTVYR